MGRVLILFISFIFSCQHSRHWDYQGRNDFHHWYEIHQDYSKCKDGSHQSPIDLNQEDAKLSHDLIEFFYHKSDAIIFNNGHTIEIDLTENNYIKYNDKIFNLEHIHFHTHSEHSLNRVLYPVEMHLVHKDKNQNTAVLAFFIEYDSQNKESYGFFKNYKQKKNKTTLELQKLVNFTGPHFSYIGSLTTPPCTENVQWIIFEKHIKLRKEQLKSFTSIYNENRRPVQRINQHNLKYISM